MSKKLNKNFFDKKVSFQLREKDEIKIKFLLKIDIHSSLNVVF